MCVCRLAWPSGSAGEVAYSVFIITLNIYPMKRLSFIIVTSLFSLNVMAQQFVICGTESDKTEKMTPAMTELYYPEVAKVTPGESVSTSAPSDAIVLFDGTDLSKWQSVNGGEAGWKINRDGTLTVNKHRNGGGDIMTRDVFGDFQLHLEWRIPENITGEGQSRGNSGVFLQGKYEVQILDSFENETYVNGMAASR